MRSLLWSLVLLFGLLAPAAGSPRLAISPVIPPGADDGPDLGRTFADLLAVHLSTSGSWTLVERGQLAPIEDEWLLKGSDLAGRAASLRIGVLSRADLVLECRVSDPTVEKPWCRIAVVETARAEVLAEREIALRARPMGPWYRSPPEADVEALSATARELLDAACARLAEWRGQPVVALLFSPPPAELGAAAEALGRIEARAREAGFRWTSLVPGAAAESEGLLHLLGYTGDAPSPWAAAADIYLWIEPGPEDVPMLCNWRPGLPVRRFSLRMDEPGLAGAVAAGLRADLRTLAGPADDAARLAVARGFLEQARTRWRAAGLGDKPEGLLTPFGSYPPLPPEQLRQLAPIHALLAAAAFLALEDHEIQELRALLDIGLTPYPAKRLMRQRYCAMADRFWVLPDGRIDWRLCADSFPSDGWLPARFDKRRIAVAAKTLATLPDALLRPLAPTLERWLRALLSNPEDGDLELFKKIWPLAVRALGNEVHEGDSSGRSDLCTTMRLGPYIWRPELERLLESAGAAIHQPPPPPAFDPRAAPTEVLGLSVRARVPQVFGEGTGRNPATGTWQRIEWLDDGTSRTTELPDYKPGPPPSNPEDVGSGGGVRTVSSLFSTFPLLAAAQARDWAKVGSLIAAGRDLAEPTGLHDERGEALSVGQSLLALAVEERQFILAGQLLDAGVKPSMDRLGLVFSRLGSPDRELTGEEIALYRRLDQAGARVPAEDIHDPFVQFFDQYDFNREFRKTEDAQVSSEPPELRALTEKQRSEEDAKALGVLKQLIALRLRDGEGSPAVDRADQQGRTPLVRAIHAEWAAGVSALLAGGADLDLGHFEGTPARRLLNAKPRLAGKVAAPGGRDAPAGLPAEGPELIAALLRHDAEFLARAVITPGALAYRDVKNWTVLHHAVAEKAEAFALRLIEAGAPLDALSEGGQTPMAFAAAGRMENLVIRMLEAGAPVNLRAGDGPTPLFQAAFSQNPSLVRRLLAAGADLSLRAEESDRTVAQAAASRGDNVAVLEVLFEAGADFQALSPGGYTLLDWAFEGNAHENLPFLYAKGVGWGKPASGLTPLQMAARENMERMTAALLACGEWDEGALSLATNPAIKAMLEDAAAHRGAKVAEDIALWPVICADRVNGVRRAAAHLAAGGNVNHAPPSGWGYTPLEMALAGMNPDLVRFLLGHGAVVRVRRGADPSVRPPTLWALVAPPWIREPRSRMPGIPPPFEATQEEWDAYAAGMVALIAPRWPDPLDAELAAEFEKSHQPRSAAALRAARAP